MSMYKKNNIIIQEKTKSEIDTKVSGIGKKRKKHKKIVNNDANNNNNSKLLNSIIMLKNMDCLWNQKDGNNELY